MRARHPVGACAPLDSRYVNSTNSSLVLDRSSGSVHAQRLRVMGGSVRGVQLCFILCSKVGEEEEEEIGGVLGRAQYLRGAW